MEAAARYLSPLAAEETGIAAGMARKKVLLADDAELLLDLEKKILVREGVTVLTAGNGREALDLVRRERPDLVFLDLDMPVMDGDECCRRIKEDPTAEVDPGRHGQRQSSGGFPLRCRTADCDAILHKPIDRQKMVEVARHHLDFPFRSDSRVPARMCIHYGTGGRAMLADYTVNLSTGGMFLETERPLAEKSLLQIAFELPGGCRQIYCRGRVAWVNAGQKRCAPHLPPGMGVQFLDLGMAELNAIREFLSARKSCPPGDR